MLHLSAYVYLTFFATVIFSIWIFYKATNHSKPFLIGLSAWIIIQSALSISGFYNNPINMTARFPLLILPPFLYLISRFINKNGRAFLDGMNLKMLTIFHIIRIPVEFVLFLLFINHAVPEAMTFHGRNFDIFSGISAPFIYYFGFIKKQLSKAIIIAWNLICLALLINVASSAILSLPSRFLQFGFEQSNIALGYFPFVLLPAVLVPLVMLATVAAVKQLLKK